MQECCLSFCRLPIEHISSVERGTNLNKQKIYGNRYREDTSIPLLLVSVWLACCPQKKAVIFVRELFFRPENTTFCFWLLCSFTFKRFHIRILSSTILMQCRGSTHNESFRSMLYSMMFLAPFSLIVTVVFLLESGSLHKQQSPIGTWTMKLDIIISKF